MAKLYAIFIVPVFHVQNVVFIVFGYASFRLE